MTDVNYFSCLTTIIFPVIHFEQYQCFWHCSFYIHQINSFFIPFGAAHPHQKEGWVVEKGIKKFLLVGPLSRKIIIFCQFNI